MDNLIKIRNQEPITTSDVLAKGTDKDHASVVRLIRRYENELKEFGTLGFEIRKSAGRPTMIAELNEPQVYFILTLMTNNPTVVVFKKRLIKEFIKMRKALISLQIEKSSNEYKSHRKEGKLQHKETTDVIQEFVRYATIQGSKNAVRYYSNISKMENKALLILEQKFPNVREVLTYHQLSTMKTADRVVVEALQYGIDKEMNYKDIYKLAKERVETLATLIKPTVVINYNEVKVIGD